MRYFTIILSLLTFYKIEAQHNITPIKKWEISAGNYVYFPFCKAFGSFPKEMNLGLRPPPTPVATNLAVKRYLTKTGGKYIMFNLNSVGYALYYGYRINSSTPSNYAVWAGFSEVEDYCTNLDFSYGMQLNINEKSRIYCKSGFNLIFNKVGAFYPSGTRYIIDSVNTFMAHDALYNEKRMGYGINQAFIFEKHLGKFSAGIGIFGQLGFRYFMVSKLDVYLNGNNYSGFLKSKGDALGVFMYIKAWSFGKFH